MTMKRTECAMCGRDANYGHSVTCPRRQRCACGKPAIRGGLQHCAVCLARKRRDEMDDR